MPSLTYVTITGDFLGGDGAPLSGTATFTASQSVYSAGQEIVTPDVPIAGQITDGHLLSESGGALQLLATDQAGLTYLTLSGFFFWTVVVTVGGLTEPEWSFGLPSSPSTVDLFARANMPFSSGGNAVASVFTRTGAVVAANGDYSVGQVTGAAPLASPALTGTPTAPTQSAGNNSTRLGTTAYADAAVAVETTRAETAEALLAPKASPALTGTPTAPTQTTGDSSTKIATDAFVATAVAVETSRATTAEGILASAVSTETSRAMSAEALLAPKASPALTGTPTAPTAGGGTNTTQLATTAFVEAALPAALPPNGSAGGVLSGSYPNPGFATTPLPESGGTMTGWLAPKVVTLTDAATVLVNAALGNDFRLLLTASGHTVGAPGNPVDGQAITIDVQQPSSGGPDTVTWASGAGGYSFGTDGAPTLSTSASAVDTIGFRYHATLGKWICLGWKLGFS